MMPSQVEFAFAMPNPTPAPGSARPCQDLTLQVSGNFGLFPTPFTKQAQQLALEGGITAGDACVLRTYSPRFIVKRIEQSCHRRVHEDRVRERLCLLAAR
jgi:hypothetical protein